MAASSSWGAWLSSKTYELSEQVKEGASAVSESSTFDQLKEGTLALAAKVGEGVEAAASVVEETTESALASASMMEKWMRKTLAT